MQEGPVTRPLEEIRSLTDPLSRYRSATDELARLQGAIQELNDIRASAMTELHAGGRSYREIAELTGVSPQRVAQLITAAAPSDTARVARAWTLIEARLVELASLVEVPISRRRGHALISALWESAQVSDEEASVLHEAFDLRNAVVHLGTAVSHEEFSRALDAVTSLTASLEERIKALRERTSETLRSDWEEGEAILRRVLREFPSVNWTAGRCEECGRAMPVPADSDELWVCSRRCRELWLRKLRHFVAAHSEDEAMTRTPKVVPYWL